MLYNIYIGRNKIHAEGAKVIAESLKVNNSIYLIDLCNL